jgi:hypothetical protein
VTPVEGTDAHSEHEVVGLLIGVKDQVLDGDLADVHAAGGNLGGGRCSGVGDCGRGSVDRQNVAGVESRGDGTRRCARAAADLEDAEIGL